jgi:hypothetical protein
MMAAPHFPEEMEREGREYARLHPEERLKVLEACDEATGGRINREATVLIWGNAAHVEGYSFWIGRDDDGEWEAKWVIF